MLGAQPGYVYWLGLEQAQAYWLRWNGGISQSGATLANSLTWPGNTHDYTDHGDSGVPLGPFPYVVRGFMEVGDTNDRKLSLNDHTSVNLGATLRDIPVQTALQEQINLDRVLRLPLLEANATINYINDGTPYVEVEQFGLFQIIGYSGNNNWLLLSFVGWDNASCSTVEPVNDVTISGANSGHINTSYTFTATALPFNATMPITTTWTASGQETITQTGGGVTSRSLAWANSGVKTITVTAQNAYSDPVTATHQITITSLANLTIGPVELVTTPPITAVMPVVFRTTITNTGEVDINSQFYVDVFINPTQIYDEYIPLSESSGYTAVSHLAAASSQVVTLTAPFGFSPDVITHTIYAMVDSLGQIEESNELDNISEPLTVTNILLPPPLITVTPSCSSSSTVNLTVTGLYWPVNEPVSIYFGGQLRIQILVHDGSFTMSWTEQSIIVGQDYEITAVSPNHNASATLTTPCQPAAPTNVTISGPTVGRIGEPLTFVATIDPETAVLPLTYTWYISETNPITHTNGLSDTLTATWNELGLQGISVIATNDYGHAIARYSFEIVEQQIFLPIIFQTNNQ